MVKRKTVSDSILIRGNHPPFRTNARAAVGVTAGMCASVHCPPAPPSLSTSSYTATYGTMERLSHHASPVRAHNHCLHAARFGDHGALN